MPKDRFRPPKADRKINMRGKKLKRNLKRSLRPVAGKKLARKKKFEPTLETASGILVRSSYERICADLLFANKIRFQYESLMLLDGKQYRPDFFLPDYNLFVEICGMNHQPYYRDRIKLKEQIYKKNRLDAVFVRYNGKGSLQEQIRQALEPYGITLKPVVQQ